MRIAAILAVIVVSVGCSLSIPIDEQVHFESARKLDESDSYRDACRFYLEFAKRYPASEHSDEALQRTCEIALSQSSTHWAHHALRDVLEEFPAAPLASEAVFKVGTYNFENNEFDEAIITFNGLIRDYPESERVEASVFLTGESELGLYEGADYDAAPLRRAKQQFEFLLRKFPSGAYVQKAKGRLRQITDELAHRDYIIALYYRKHGKPAGMKVYLELVVKRYPETEYAQRAEKILSSIEETEK